MSPSVNDAAGVDGTTNEPAVHYEKPAMEQELRADLEELWQSESPGTARRTDIADEVDGHLGTRNRSAEEV